MSDQKTTTRKAAPDKGAAARAEVNGKPKTLEFEGLTLELPGKLPFKVLRYIHEGGAAATIGALQAIVGEKQMEAIWGLDLDLDRGEELVDQVLDAYGLASGE